MNSEQTKIIQVHVFQDFLSEAISIKLRRSRSAGIVLIKEIIILRV